jgi:hypothetical protein
VKSKYLIGEYEFFPPDQTIDGPGVDDAGDVAVISVEVTVGCCLTAQPVRCRGARLSGPSACMVFFR